MMKICEPLHDLNHTKVSLSQPTINSSKGKTTFNNLIILFIFTFIFHILKKL